MYNKTVFKTFVLLSGSAFILAEKIKTKNSNTFSFASLYMYGCNINFTYTVVYSNTRVVETITID